MDAYRLYFVDDQGRIKHGAVLLCDTDEKALEAAEQHRDGLDLELWTSTRMVAKIPKLHSPT